MSIESIIRELLAVLLKLLGLFVSFIIQALLLVLDFAQTTFGSLI